MKKYTPAILVIIALFCFFSNYEIGGILGFILIFVSMAIFSAENKQSLPVESSENLPRKGVNKGLFLLVISTVIEVSLLSFSFNGYHPTLFWVAFLSAPFYLIIFIISLSLMS